MNKLIPLAFVVVGLALIGVVMLRHRQPPAAPASKTASSGHAIDNFTLTNRTGKTFSASQLKGKVWVASFFFASCPTTCTKQNQAVAGLVDEFAERGVKFVSITCDPENDTPQALQAYAAKLQAKPDEWFFLTGEMTEIRKIGAEAFQVLVERQTHSNRLMLIDKWGNLRGRFNWQDPRELESLKKRIAELLDERAPPAGKST